MTIKNGHNQFVAVNEAFLNFLKLPVDYPIIGKTLNELPTSLAYLSHNLHCQEDLVMRHKEKVSSIVTHPVGDSNALQALCFDSCPYYDDHGSCSGTMLHVRHMDMFSPSYLLEDDVPKPLMYQCPSMFFTNAEWEVIFLIAMKYSRKVMSRMLNLSLKAIEHRISSCLQKTGASCGEDLIRYCRDKGWDTYIPPRFMKPKFRLLKPVATCT